MPLNFHHSEWKTGSHNAIILECLKSPSPYFWKTLYLTKQPPSKKPQLWWKVIEKYRSNLGNFIYELETTSEEEDISAHVRRQNRLKKTKWAQKYDPHS